MDMNSAALRFAVIPAVAIFLSASSATANLMLGPAIAQEAGINPGLLVSINSSGFYSGGAWAGVNHLNITQNGITGVYDGFCIDPFHYSPNTPDDMYKVTTLEAHDYAPAISAEHVALIEQLLSHYYRPTLSNAEAAALQVAIWETVGGTSFSANGYNDTWYSGYIAAASGAAMSDHLVLDGATHQDYVLVSSVPDGGMTAVLLGLGLLALGLVRRAVR